MGLTREQLDEFAATRSQQKAVKAQEEENLMK